MLLLAHIKRTGPEWVGCRFFFVECTCVYICVSLQAYGRGENGVQCAPRFACVSYQWRSWKNPRVRRAPLRNISPRASGKSVLWFRCMTGFLQTLYWSLIGERDGPVRPRLSYRLFVGLAGLRAMGSGEIGFKRKGVPSVVCTSQGCKLAGI